MERRFILDIPLPEGTTQEDLLKSMLAATASVLVDLPKGVIRGKATLDGMVFLDEKMVGQWEIKRDE